MGPEGRRRGSKPPIHALSIYLSCTFFPLPLFHRFLSVLPWNPSSFHFLPLLTIVTIFLTLFLSLFHISISLFLSISSFSTFSILFSIFSLSSLSIYLLFCSFIFFIFILILSYGYTFLFSCSSLFFIQRRSMRAVKKDSFIRLVGFWRKPMMVQRGLRRH